ncbi:MAG TPA: polysaccharide biosynthesis tyrosine autokinase [Thermoanaerobaculia bacterium]|nr:polysaccharide biosynthesis tyrosine autokinase [Thermoanaerobaculia bacterium]
MKNPSFRDPALELAAEPAESEFDITEYVGMLRRHWRLIAACAITALVLGVAHYLITPKEYMAIATVQIERKSAAPVLSDQNTWDNYWNIEFYPTQYELLRSRGLAERVVRNLDLTNSRNVASDRTAGAAEPGKAPAVPATAAEDASALGAAAQGLLGGLSVDPIRSTSLVQIGYRSKDPVYAARVANAFAEAYIDLGIEDRYTSAGKASSFLSSQIETLKSEIQEKENELQRFSRTSDIVGGVDPASNDVLKRLETLNNDFLGAKRVRIEKEARYHELQIAPKETVADSLSGGVVSELRSNQLKMERDYETKLKTYKPDWPAMVSLKADIDKGQQHLKALIEEMGARARSDAFADYQTALRQEQTLASEVSRSKGEAINQSSAAVEYTNLKVEIETRRQMFDELLKKQSETEVSARLQGTRDSNIRIIDSALTPGGPFRPSLRQDVTYGMMLGLLLGVGIALLIEFLDRTIKSPEEIERRLKLPTLAVVPDIAETGRVYGYGGGTGKSAADRGKAAVPDREQIELVPHDRPRSPISEVYRSLRTSLLLSTAEELKVIAVTSATAGEGKTATTSNLGVVLAQLGRRVLIVDADLRKPRMHQVFKVSNRSGLVNQLTGVVEPDSVFVETGVPNLWLIPSGPIPPNPSELLSSDRMREWLNAMRARFDYVIIDTPPSLAVTDATIVGALSDGIVLTFRAGKVTREDAKDCAERLRMAELRILGVVLNRHRSEAARYGRKTRYYEAYGGYEREAQAV